MDPLYSPSLQNRFFDAVRRLPVPRRLLFLLITAGFAFLNFSVAWLEGSLAVGNIDLYQFNFQIWLLVVMVGGDYFTAAAGSAIDRFRPALDVDDDEYRLIRHAYTTVSARDGLILTGLGLVFSFWGISFGEPYQREGLPAVVLYLTSAYMFAFVFFFMWFLWRIVRGTANLYGRIQRVNLFHLDPLHAFSGLSSRIGMFLIFTGVLSYMTNFVLAESPNAAGFAFFATINVTVAISAFIYPLHGIHLRLEIAKERMSQANDGKLEAAYQELHRRADGGELVGMSELHHEIQALLEFRREIEATSTWPWAPGTLRTFGTALLLPIVLWVTQQVLQRLLAS